jgi:hypothetical protein
LTNHTIHKSYIKKRVKSLRRFGAGRTAIKNEGVRALQILPDEWFLAVRRSQVCRDGQTVQENLSEDQTNQAEARNSGSRQASQVYTECGYNEKVSGPDHGGPTLSVQGTLWRIL